MKQIIPISCRVICFLALLCQICMAEPPFYKVYYQADTRAPLTRFEIVYLISGTEQESDAKIGIPRVVQEVLLASAANRELKEKWASLGAEIDIKADEHRLIISGLVLSEFFFETIRVAGELLHPRAFHTIDLEVVKSRIRNEYQSEIQINGLNLIKRYALYGRTPEGMIGSLRDLSKITQKDVTLKLDNFANAELLLIKVVSDMAYAQIKNGIESLLGNRQKIDTPIVHRKRLPKPITRRVVIFPIPSSVDYCFWIIPYEIHTQKASAYELIADVLGNDADGILYHYLREQEKLCYNPYCTINQNGDRSYLKMFADPPAKNTERLIKEWLILIRNLKTNSEFWALLKDLRSARYPLDLSPWQKIEASVNADLNPISASRLKASTLSEEDRSDRIKAVLDEFSELKHSIVIFAGNSDRLQRVVSKNFPEFKVEIITTDKMIE